MRPSGEPGDRAMPTPSRLAKPTKPGRETEPCVKNIPANTVGHYRSETIQYRSKVFQIHAAKNWRGLGDIPHHPGGVRARLSLRLRGLHGDGLFRRLHPR